MENTVTAGKSFDGCAIRVAVIHQTGRNVTCFSCVTYFILPMQEIEKLLANLVVSQSFYSFKIILHCRTLATKIKVKGSSSTLRLV